MESKDLSVTLTVSEWNVVMQAVGAMPYAQVAALIPKIQNQANTQLNTAEPKAE